MSEPNAQEDKSTLVNWYRHCDTSWVMVWSCACDDRCPVCNAEIEPYESEELGG